MKKSVMLREKLAKLGVDFEFDNAHYQKAHKDIKGFIDHLLERIEAKPSLEFTTKELEYLIYYVSDRATSDLMASKLVEKILDEIRRRKERTVTEAKG